MDVGDARAVRLVADTDYLAKRRIFIRLNGEGDRWILCLPGFKNVDQFDDGDGLVVQSQMRRARANAYNQWLAG